jgi:hypothetical protein
LRADRAARHDPLKQLLMLRLIVVLLLIPIAIFILLAGS